MNKSLKVFGVIALAMLVVVAVILGILKDDYSSLYDFFNNQTISVLVGISTVMLAYYFWKKQHETELSSKYFEELLAVTLDILYYDDVLIYEFEGQKNEESDKIFRQKMLLSGRQDTYMMLLEHLGDSRPKKLRKSLKDYGDKYIEALTKCRTHGLEAIQEDYSNLRKEVRFKVLDLVGIPKN